MGAEGSGRLGRWRWTSLGSESDGDVFVGTILPSLGRSWGERGESIGSVTKLFEKVFSHEFQNLKLFFKNSRFSIFLNPSFLPESGVIFLKWWGCLRTHRFLSC